jgi:PilZ domain
MGRRHYQRHLLQVPVTVSGLDTLGKPFTQSATTVEISAHGLHLRGISCLRAVGDPVQIKYKYRTATYRVAWIGKPGTSLHGLVGLEGQGEAPLLFADLGLDFQPRPDPYQLPAEPEPVSPVVPSPPRPQQERRSYPRYNCAGVANVWEKDDECAVSGRLNEISRCGCYIETMSPLRVGTSIGLELSLRARIIRLQGIVRTSQPTIGMGVEFIRMMPAEAEKLCQVVAVLAGELPDAPPPDPAPPPKSLASMSEAEIGEAVLQWFGAHEVLSRQELLKLVEQSERAAETMAVK